VPFHLLGGALYPSSLKLAASGQIPVSIMPMMMSDSLAGFCIAVSGKPKKSHDLVVWSWRVLLGNTETMPFLSLKFAKRQSICDSSIACQMRTNTYNIQC